jgi:hypothetical protein
VTQSLKILSVFGTRPKADTSGDRQYPLDHAGVRVLRLNEFSATFSNYLT